MKRVLALLTFALTALVTAPSAASAQESATVMLLHGIPGATVDVVVDGQVVIPDFEPGTMQDLSSFAGQTLSNVEVRAAGTDDVVIGPIDTLDVPASGNWTVTRPSAGGRHPDVDAVRERHQPRSPRDKED